MMKHMQDIVSFHCLETMEQKESKKQKEQEAECFVMFHGVDGNPDSIGCSEQFVHGTHGFEHFFDHEVPTVADKNG